MKLTPWFSGDQKPVRKGVYQRVFKNKKHYSFFNGMRWFVGSGSPSTARTYEGWDTSFQNLPWRGVMK